MAKKRTKTTAYSSSFNAKIRFFIIAFVMLSISGGITAGFLISKSGVEEEAVSSDLQFENPEVREVILEPPISQQCSFWAIDDENGNSSNLFMINDLLTESSKINSYSCSSGICDFEAMDRDKNGDLYAVANSVKSLYKINPNRQDGNPGSNLSFQASLYPEFNITGMSFRKSDNSLWAWVPGRGLYTINPAGGAMTLRLASSLDFMHGMAWDNNSQYLYLSMTSPVDYELWRYSAVTNIMELSGSLPGDTDALDFSGDGYLYGVYGADAGSVNIFAYDVEINETVSSSSFTTESGNIDALASCND